MALRITILVGVLALLLGAPAATLAQEADGAEAEAIAAAKAAAKEWLALLDAWDFTGTWEQAGELLKAAVEQRRWERQMSVTLGPLGRAQSRAVRSSEYSTTMPGAPDGEYVEIKYDTSFENKQTAMETVVMRKETDGAWRVSGYFIK
jgi:hypothetical protein